MDSSKIDEEKLREAACYGDLEAVQNLIKRGVNVNAQHSINGWTALHWSAKRNNFEVSQYLVAHGADANATSFSKELAADLTTNPAILNLLGSLPAKENRKEQPLPIVPNYLANPELSHKVEVNDTRSRPKAIPSVTMPSNSIDELVIKLRLAYTSDTDFIEVELSRSSDLTYARLMEICCAELGINPKYVERLRKLPDTRLRKDSDVQRLRNLQELEVVLLGSKPKVAVATEASSGTLTPNSQPILY